MSGGDDEAKLAYLAKHRVPVLLDAMVSRLLEAMPEDPASFLSGIDARHLTDSSGSPAAANGTRKPSVEKTGSAIRKGSADGQPRRASFTGGVRFGGDDEGSEAPKKKAALAEGPVAKRKPAEGGEKISKQAISNIKNVRREFFESYAKEEWGNSNVRCVHIGCIALALSYLIKGKRDEPVAKRVTTEDVFFYARLPLHYVSNSGITLAELYDIAVTFTQKDPRFKRTTDVQLVHFDTRLAEGEVDATTGTQSGDRGPCVTLPAFRKAMERDSRDDRHIRVFNFDPFVAEQASLALLEEEDEDDDEEEKAKRMPMAKRKNRGAYAVFTEFNAFKAAVKLSECNIEEEVKVRYREVLLTAMYKACCAIDAFSKRPRGYIEFRGDAANFENVDIDPDDEVDTHWKAPCCIDDELLDADPRTARGTSLTDAASHISPHAIAVAFGFHLIQGASQQIGINIGDIMSTNQMPLHVMINEAMELDQVQAYTQAYIEKKGLLEHIGVSAHNISTLEGVEDAAPSMSVMDLECYLNGVMKAASDPKEPAVVMVVNFEVNTAHNVLGLEQGSVPSHWGVVVSYDQDEQLVRIGDIMPKKFCKHWNVPLTRLHTALTGKGFLLFSRLTNGVPPKISGVPAIPRPVSANTRHTADRHSNPVVVGDPLQTFEFPSSIYCITAVALAFSRLQFPTSVEDVIYKSGIDISFLLSDHVSLHDIRRIAAYVVKEQQIPLTTHVAICDVGLDGKLQFTDEDFRQMLEKHVPNAAEYCVVLNFNAESVHSHQHFHTHNGGDYAIVLAYDPSSRMVTCCDANPQKYYRTWTSPADVVYGAMKEEDYASKRPRGYMLVEKKAPASSTQRQFDVRRVKNRHPLKVPTSPHISALAFALSELGSVCSPEDIFYTAYDAIRQSNAEVPAVFSLNSIKTAFTLSGMAELGRAYASTHNIHKAISIRAINEQNTITPADFETEIQSAVSGLHVLIVLYSSGLAHNSKGGEVSSALVKSFNKSTNTVTLSDTNTTKYAYEWHITLENLLKCCTGEGDTRGFVRVGK